MGYSLRRLAILAALVATSHQTAPPNINQPFEVDAIFPRPIDQTSGFQDIQTFKANEIIPLVLAVQNMTAWTVGNMTMRFEWYIVAIHANTTQDRIVDWGVFDTTDASKANADPAYLVAVSDSSKWYRNFSSKPEWAVPPKAPGDLYLFEWSVTPYARDDRRCYFFIDSDPLPNVFAWNTSSIFDVLAESEDKSFYNATIITSAAAKVAIPQQGCPDFVGFYQATFNETARECQAGVAEVKTMIQGNPCAAKVDSAVASSISSRVASSISAWNAPRTTTTTRATAAATSTSSGGVGVVQPLQTAMAAACLLCGLVLS